MIQKQGQIFEFPAVTKISFHSLIESLENLSKTGDKSQQDYANDLLEIVDKHPFLKEGFDDYSYLDTYKDEVAMLSRALFPDVLLTNEIKGLTPPFDFEPFYVSTRFQNIMDATGDDKFYGPTGYTPDMMYIFGCAAILNNVYQMPVDLSSAMVLEIPNASTGLLRSYRVAFNADMIDMYPTDKAPKITQEDYQELINNFENIDLWKEKFPPNSYLMKGIGIVNLMDVTIDASVTGIAANLLIKSDDGFEKIKNNIRHIFGNKQLEIGIVSFENGVFTRPHKGEISSILMQDDEMMDCIESMCSYSFDHLINHKERFIVPDVEQFDKRANTKMSKRIKEAGMGSYIIAPLLHNDDFLGFLEIGSKNKFELNTFSNYKLDRIVPIISMAASRFKEETKNRIEAVIQQECTTIHSAVKWKFEEAAYKYIQKKERSESANFKDIVFKDVYPLYGQLDIKGSSTIRNDAVTSDLVTQVEEINKVLKKAYKHKKLPILEELMYRVDTYKKEIVSGLLAGSEHKILAFVHSEIYPVFKHLKKEDPTLAEFVKKYNSKLDDTLHIIYKERKKFDESVMQINQTLANYIDQKQLEAQSMFPHYFERYKTDGVEYNMYIGQSMAQTAKFDALYLRNLRLWQLITQCEMEQAMDHLKKELDTPLDVASLILVYSTPLAIHFRMDEKRFDVEGAYNARYEIVKKRVDKAHIKDTKERITQPGKIAIIYTSDQDAFEYKKYIAYLENKGYLIKNSLEDLQLENLQGISGLKALRVSVNYNGKQKDSLTMDEIMQEIRKS